ncbi:MAG: hypothetical protein AB7P18_22110 [Candidatus Binatia bacterium]
MSLLQDLQNIDLSGIIQARGNIRTAVEAPALQEVLRGGAAQTALAGLGGAVADLRENFDNPQTLLQPLSQAITELANQFDIEQVPLTRYLDAVREGATIIGGIFENLSGDPAQLGRFLGASLSETLEAAGGTVRSIGQQSGDAAAQFRRLSNLVDGGVPTDPQALGELIVDVLLPFGKTNLVQLRNGVQGVLQGAGGISLPRDRTAGLVIALDAVTTAAVSADRTRLQHALRELEQVRTHTLDSLHSECVTMVGQLGHLRLGETLPGLTRLSRALRTVDDGVLEFLDTWRAQITLARQQVETLDLTQIREFLAFLPGFLETQARVAIVEPIDAQVERLKEWVRNLLRHLPLRELRAEISHFIHTVAQAIQDAGLDGPVRTVRSTLQSIRANLNPAALAAEVQQALQQVEETISTALDGVIAALEEISTQINSVTGQAQAVLEQLASALTGFKQTLASLSAAVDNLGVDQAAQQVVTTLSTLRETAEKLLQSQPLPEPLRPTVEQLIETLKEVDFDEVLQPVRQAANELTIPADVSDTVNDGLVAAKQVVENLIPAELIASIEAEISQALAVIGDFNPASLLPSVTDFLNEAAQFVEELDPRTAVDEIREPFQAVIELIDKVHPRILLAPVIQQYDALLGNIPIPPPDTAARRTADLVNSSGNTLGRVMLEPLQQLDPQGEAEISQPGTRQPTAQAPDIDGVRPGDVIRLFGYVPGKLRAALSGVAAGPAAQALAVVENLSSGLARDLRRLQVELFAVEERLDSTIEQFLSPLADAQLRAQFAIQANFSAGEIDVNASINAVALAGPGPLREVLGESTRMVRERLHGAVAHAGGSVGSELDRAARTLESLRLSRLTGDLTALLDALDPEPIAAEIDALVATVVARTPTLLRELESEVQTTLQKVRAIVNDLNPGVQAQKFLSVLDVVRAELDVLNPRRLADELSEVHAAVRNTLVMYDPAVFAAEIRETLLSIGADIRALDPATLLGDMSFLETTVNRVADAVPTQALQGVGTSLETVGQQLTELNPAELIEALNQLGPRVVEAFADAVDAIRNEIVMLLESLRFASGSASVSVSASVG